MGKNSRLGGVFLGGAIGAILGILYAPRAGEETRALVSEKMDEYWGQGKELYEDGFEKVQHRAGEVAEQLQERYGDVTEKVQERYEEITDKVEDTGARFVPQPSSSSDELRAKIDEARSRIAAQIQQNSEEAGEPLRETAPSASSKFESLDSEDDRYTHWNPAEAWMEPKEDDNK